jgi:chemotaxis protein methyltransferase CheR
MSVQEMQHRIANSLQIIASTLLITSRAACSDETRRHLFDVHHRIMSVATLQQQLQAAGTGATVELGPYLSRLCATLAVSLIGERRAISLRARVNRGTASSSDAVSLGLVVTELVINALKHGFPGDRAGMVDVTYDGAGPNWKLDVTDNGIGEPDDGPIAPHRGKGTSILKALAVQLDARLSVSAGPLGTTVSLVHARRVRTSLPSRARAGLANPQSPAIRSRIMPSQPREAATCGSF